MVLGELATFVSGGTPSRQKPEFYAGQIPWVTGADIDLRGQVSARSFITPDALVGSAASVVPAGTLLLVTRTSVGKVGLPLEATAFSQDITAIRHDSTRVDRDYLMQYLRSQEQHFASRSRGATIKGVTREAVTDLVVPLPSLEEQRSIAAILDQADTLRAKRRLALSRVDDLARSIFLDLFGHPMSNTRMMPTARIGDVADVVTGNSPPRADPSNFGDAIEWIKSGNLGGEIATVAEEWLSTVGRTRARVVPSGSVLITCIAGSPASIGKCSLVDRDVAFNQQINAVVPSPMVNMAFLLWQLKVAPGLVRAKSSGGMKGLVSKSSFSSIEVLLPPMDLQKKFADRARHVSEMRAMALRSSVAEDELLSSLQGRAFQGAL